jgi:hypothetical protein
MEWETDNAGNIVLVPMVTFRTGKLLDMSIAVQMTFSRPEDEPGTASLVVQAAMTVPQVREFAEVLLQTADELLAPPHHLPN